MTFKRDDNHDMCDHDNEQGRHNLPPALPLFPRLVTGPDVASDPHTSDLRRRRPLALVPRLRARRLLPPRLVRGAKGSLESPRQPLRHRALFVV